MRTGISIGILTVSFLLAIALPGHAFNCNVNVTGLNFGGYDVFSTFPRDATAVITVNCNIPPQNPFAPLAVTISLSPGNSGTYAQRKMQGPGSTLAYNLYTTPSFSTAWGDGSGGSQTQTNFVTRVAPWSATIYGRIPARQNVKGGIYGDVITITVEW